MILLLSSPQDGEVVAAARAIGRALKADGKDWHWLADRLDIVSRPDPENVRYEPPRRERTFSTPDLSELKDMVYEIVEYMRHSRRLMTMSETRFIDDMNWRFDQYELESVRISEKQAAFIRSVHDKYVMGKRGGW